VKRKKLDNLNPLPEWAELAARQEVWVDQLKKPKISKELLKGFWLI
jgi:hypothetical protein